MNSPELRDQPIGELFKRLATDLSKLVRQEFELLRREMAEKGKRVGTQVGQGAGMLSGAAVCGLMGLASLTVTIILALALVMPAWAAALIVTIAYGIVAAFMTIAGKKTLTNLQAPVPSETIETVKEDVEWAKTEMTSAPK